MSAAPNAPAAAAAPGAGRVRAALATDGRARFGVAVIVLLARHDPTAIDLGNALRAPSAAHWLGTDVQGRDVWARLAYGARAAVAREQRPHAAPRPDGGRGDVAVRAGRGRHVCRRHGSRSSGGVSAGWCFQRRCCQKYCSGARRTQRSSICV